MLWLFTNKMADSLQIEKKYPINEPPSYDDFVDTSFAAMARAGPKEQSQASLDIMLSMLPPDGPAVFRKLFPVAKWSCELNAAITKWVFAWMVGPMTLEERDVPNEWSGEGSTRMKSVVVIEKHARAPIGPSEFAPAIRGGDLDEQDQVAPEGDWVVWPV